MYYESRCENHTFYADAFSIISIESALLKLWYGYLFNLNSRTCLYLYKQNIERYSSIILLLLIVVFYTFRALLCKSIFKFRILFIILVLILDHMRCKRSIIFTFTLNWIRGTYLFKMIQCEKNKSKNCVTLASLFDITQ